MELVQRFAASLVLILLFLGGLSIVVFLDSMLGNGLTNAVVEIATSARSTGFFILLSAIIAAAVAHSKFNLDWHNSMAEFHDQFWNDEGHSQVRNWIACDASYESDLEPILTKREEGNRTLASEEYAEIDKLDKFLALLTRVVCMPTWYVRDSKQMLDRLFLNYGLSRVCEKLKSDTIERTLLYSYVERFYPFIWDHYQQNRERFRAQQSD